MGAVLRGALADALVARPECPARGIVGFVSSRSSSSFNQSLCFGAGGHQAEQHERDKGG